MKIIICIISGLLLITSIIIYLHIDSKYDSSFVAAIDKYLMEISDYWNNRND